MSPDVGSPHSEERAYAKRRWTGRVGARGGQRTRREEEAMTTTIDPVCGMDVDPATAAGHSEHAGHHYSFCSASCKGRFDADPERFVAAEPPPVVEKTPLNRDRHTRSTPDGEAERVDLSVTGMTCAACARRIEKQLSKAPGVRHASVNFATSRATVEYDPAATGVR